MKFWFFLMVFSSLVSANAHAGYKSGNDIKPGLETSEGGGSDYLATWSFGYVIGVADTLQSVNYVCIPGGPNGVRAGQLSSVVLKHLRNNPENLHNSAEVLIYQALVKQWPCKNAAQSNDGEAGAPVPKSSPKPKPKPKPIQESPF